MGSDIRIRVLGSAGWMPRDGSETNCQLIECSGELVMLDAGTGVANLIHYKELLEKYDTVHVLLGHYHLDHVIGVSYLSNFLADHNIIFYTPSRKYYGADGEAVLGKLLSPEFFARRVEKLGKSVAFVSYEEGGFSIGNIAVRARLQQHSAPSFAFLFDGKFAYVTDTKVDDETFSMIKDAALVFHECWDFKKTLLPHSSLEELAVKAAEYPGMKICLMHRNPDYSPGEYEEKAAGTSLYVLRDGMSLILTQDGKIIYE